MSRQNPKDRKASILDAALRMSINYGYQRVTRADIAASAECSEALVSSYFGTMTQVRRAVMRAAVHQEIWLVVAQGLVAKDPIAMKASESVRKIAASALLK